METLEKTYVTQLTIVINPNSICMHASKDPQFNSTLNNRGREEVHKSTLGTLLKGRGKCKNNSC